MSTAPVLFEETASTGGKLGRITLNVPATLNSLTLEMVDLIQARLDAWREDPELAAIFIVGAGEKGLCAGGDVQALRNSSLAQPGGPCEYAEAFFAREYRMNYSLHTYPKPLICWGHGIVMGGGLGILAGCSHRVVTERTRIAMPEVGIALFPDVGGSWFLNHMPGKAGEFLALTGASINAADALFTGIGDRFISSEMECAVLQQLSRQHWLADAQANHALVRGVLRDFAERSSEALPGGQVAPHLELINSLCEADNVHVLLDNICSLVTDDPWLVRARDNLAAGSPLAARWIYRQLRETRHASLREVFQAEIQLVTNIIRYPEFAEGVRALLVDKDRKPAWAYPASRQAPDAVLDDFFTAPWERNPLADL